MKGTVFQQGSSGTPWEVLFVLFLCRLGNDFKAFVLAGKARAGMGAVCRRQQRKNDLA